MGRRGAVTMVDVAVTVVILTVGMGMNHGEMLYYNITKVHRGTVKVCQ